jgi:hypothetical protein
MLKSRAACAAEHFGCHTFCATGITAYLKNGGRLDSYVAELLLYIGDLVMSKAPKNSGSNPYPKPNYTSTPDQKRSVTGDLHVRGEVVFEPGPEEKLSRKFAETKQDSQYREKKWIERGTLAIVTFYAGLTWWQAHTTQTIADLTRKQFTSDQRPYMVIDFRPYQITAGKPISVSLSDANYGKSPAMHVAVRRKVFFGPNAQSLADQFFEQLPPSLSAGGGGMTVPPNYVPPSGADSGYAKFVATSDKAVTNEDVLWITSHSGGVFIVGRIIYDDIAGNHYSTDFCGKTMAGETMSGDTMPCWKHNEMK